MVSRVVTPVWTRAGMFLRHARLRYEFLVECAPGEAWRRGGGRASTPALIREQTKDTIIIFIGDGGAGPGQGGRAGRNVDVRYIYFGRNTAAMMSSSIFERLPVCGRDREILVSRSPRHSYRFSLRLYVVVGISLSRCRHRQLLSFSTRSTIFALSLLRLIEITHEHYIGS